VWSLRLQEPQVADAPAVGFSLRGYLGQLMTGARQLVTPSLLPYLPLIFALPGVFFLYSWGIVMPAVGIQFGLNADALGVFVAVVYTVVAVAVRALPFIRRRWGDLAGLTGLSLLMNVALIAMALPLGGAGVVVMFMMHLGGGVSRSWMSIVVNERTPSDIRATTLSTMALLFKLPYVLVAALVGGMIEDGLLGVFTVTVGVVALGLLAGGHVLAYRHAQRVRA
jgi:hypothetical protein